MDVRETRERENQRERGFRGGGGGAYTRNYTALGRMFLPQTEVKQLQSTQTECLPVRLPPSYYNRLPPHVLSQRDVNRGGEHEPNTLNQALKFKMETEGKTDYPLPHDHLQSLNAVE